MVEWRWSFVAKVGPEKPVINVQREGTK